MKKNWFTNNLGLKILAFGLAVVTWFYIVGELNKGDLEKRATLMRLYPYKVSAKRIPIRLNLVGEPLGGFEVESDKIILNPDTCILIGPKDVIEAIKEVTTEPINISEYTRTFTKELSLLPVGKDIVLEGQFTTVTIPIIRIPEKKEGPESKPST